MELFTVRKILLKLLHQYYALIRRATFDCLEDVSAEMFSRNLISKPVRDSPAYGAIICEFESGLDLKSTVSELSQHCNDFVQSLDAGSKGGPALLAAHSLVNDWNEELAKELQHHFCLHILQGRKQ